MFNTKVFAVLLFIIVYKCFKKEKEKRSRLDSI